MTARVSFAVLAVLCALSARAGRLEDGFRAPPAEAQPHVWWHWMNGNVTREGITADLESMAAVGIGGAQVFDAGCGISAGPVAFNSPEWFDMFAFAAAEAKRLGLELCHANCSGWSSSGGPWIPADKAMKVLLEPGETDVLRGPSKFEGKVPRPKFRKSASGTKPFGEFYDDIAVLAVPASVAKCLRLEDWGSKTFLGRRNDCVRDRRVAAPGEAIDRTGVIDLTARFDRRTERLSWDVPAGEWTVLRIGFASNGQCNHPASEHGVGYEVDKLSEEAVRFHMDRYCAKLVERLGDCAGKRSYGLNNILVDSYEVGSQNWTQGFERVFEKAKGYSLVPYLPLLAGGYVVGSVEESERFLEDFRRVVADEFARNYAGGLAKRCHELGLRLSLEPYGNCPADNLQYGMYADIPTAEFWSHGSHRNADEGNARIAAHVAHAWGRRIVAAEAFTADPYRGGRWTTTPFTLKSEGDCAYAAGVNRIVYHRFVHQPWKEGYLPGLTMGRWGMHFERSNTWWYEQKEWLRYQARCQWMLMEGRFCADILYYYGEGAPNVRADVYYGLDNPRDNPVGYDYDQCAREVVKALEVKDGRLVGPAGVSYAVLVLPPDDAMSLDILQKLESLADRGATIVGTVKPVRAPGLGPDDAKVREIADRIWGVKIKTCSPIAALKAKGVQPDCLCETEKVEHSWIHRRGEDGSDWYFVAARNASALDKLEMSFVDTGRVPELWNPETGAIEKARTVDKSWAGRLVVTIRDFPPDGSVFIVFRGKAEGLPTAREWKVRSATPVYGPWRLAFPAGRKAPAEVTLPALCDWAVHPDPGVRYFSGTATYFLSLPRPAVGAGERAVLDLGDVRHFAQVTVDGKAFPSMWRPPFRQDITAALGDSSAKEMKVEIRVTNLWPNRLIGDDVECAEDCEWKKDTGFWDKGAIERIPDWVRRGEKSPTGRCTFASWKHWDKDDDPLPSGLLGPVALRVESVR